MLDMDEPYGMLKEVTGFAYTTFESVKPAVPKFAWGARTHGRSGSMVTLSSAVTNTIEVCESTNTRSHRLKKEPMASGQSLPERTNSRLEMVLFPTANLR